MRDVLKHLAAFPEPKADDVRAVRSPLDHS